MCQQTQKIWTYALIHIQNQGIEIIVNDTLVQLQQEKSQASNRSQ